MNSSSKCIRLPQTIEFKRAGDWLNAIGAESKAMAILMPIYGEDPDLINERRRLIAKALEMFVNIYGDDTEVIIARSPCRINLRGMHSEMQYATPNYLTHAREVVVVASRRDDDIVRLKNVDSGRFAERMFSISEELSYGDSSDWIKYIESPNVRKVLAQNRGDWANYVKASVLRIQSLYTQSRLRGMNAVVAGDIPQGSGLASSSAVVVASGLAFMAVNNIKMERGELAISLGQGEWFVGTRGGFGDHGAMLFGSRDAILHSTFLKLEDINPEYIQFPKDYQVIVINSYRTSSKSAERLFAYNKTMFAYSIAVSLIKNAMRKMGFPNDLIDQISYLGQITPAKFGLKTIYEILKALPENIKVEELRKLDPHDVSTKLDRFFGQLKSYPESIEPRGAALWGIAESERSREFARLISEGKIKEAGQLMFIGHDGDRLYSFDGNGFWTEFLENLVTDAYLDTLISDIESGDQERLERSQLSKQPGDFNASSFELDMIVDIIRRIPGVVGASLTGAGFGGNIIALCKRDESVLRSIKSSIFSQYYEPQERQELEWIEDSSELEVVMGNELDNVRKRLREIVAKKQEKKLPMEEPDLLFTQSIQAIVNRAFKEGHLSREMLYIPADYYSNGIFVNVPVEHADLIPFR